MDWSQALSQVIDLRSFSSIWYWMVVAVVWSSVSHWVLGVPYDLIQRAKKHGGQAEEDLHDILRVNVNRLMHISGSAGSLMTAFLFFILSMLMGLGFFYGVELAQAIFFLALPLCIVGALSLSSAKLIQDKQPQDDELFAALSRHRLWTQIIGMIAIFITAMYGMFQNLDIVRFL